MNDRGYILYLAAEARELSGLATRQGARKLDWPVDYACMNDDAIFAANGPGAELAASAVRAIAGRAPLRAIVSTGYCGALEPGLAVAEVVIADSILCEDGRRYPTAARGRETDVARVGPVLSLDRVAVTAEEKIRLRRATGAFAVEMEAAGVARVAEDLGVAYHCVRVVSDTSAEDMAIDFNRYRNADGRFSRLRIAAAAMMQPSRIPALRKLDANCRMASTTLGGFLADCRF